MATITDEPASVAAVLRQAIADFDRAIRLRPDDPDAFLNRGKAYLELSHYDWAIADFDRAIRLRPDDPDALLRRGLARAAKAIDEDRSSGEFKMVMTISAEVRDLLARLAAEAGGTEFDAIGRAIALYAVAIDARKEGKGIGIFGPDFELEREISGL